MSEQFKESDILKYSSFVLYYKAISLLRSKNIEPFLRVTYEFDKFKLPVELFTYILLEKRPDLKKYAPYDVHVKKLNRGLNPWLQETHYLGLNDKDKLVLFLDENFEHSEVELLWILFHEFRHKIQ